MEFKKNSVFKTLFHRVGLRTNLIEQKHKIPQLRGFTFRAREGWADTRDNCCHYCYSYTRNILNAKFR